MIGSATQTTAGFGPTWLNTPDHWQTIQYPDVDDDGRADVCGRGNDGIYCAMGASSFSDTSLRLADFNNAGGWDSDSAYWSTIQFPDVNGDGRSDICAQSLVAYLKPPSNRAPDLPDLGPCLLLETPRRRRESDQSESREEARRGFGNDGRNGPSDGSRNQIASLDLLGEILARG